MKAVFGSKTLQALANCGPLSERVGLSLSPAVVYYSALATIDPVGAAVTPELRDSALELTARYLRAEPGRNAGGEQKIAQLLDYVGGKTQGVVTPLDLLVASANAMPEAIGAGLAGSGLSAASVLERLRAQIPEEALADEVAWPPENSDFRFAVVIEGPGFHDERNRYPTMEIAQRAVKAFAQLSHGEPITHGGPGEGFFMIDPPRLKEATRIYVREL